MKTLNLNAIRIDGGTQPRESINMGAVDDYAEAVKAGVEFPPVIVFNDGAEHWLADGFHRWHAHKQAGKVSICADVRAGTVDDARWFASACNDSHGLRRSNADKRAAVLMALGVRADQSDNAIANHVGVSHPFVADVRRSILKPLQDAPAVRTVERAGKTYQQDTSRIGKSQPTSTPAQKLAPWDKKPEPTPALDEAREAVTILSDENERLNDRLAVEAMNASEEEKTLAKETIESLRAQVKTLTAELSAVKASRDGAMRELAEVKRQCQMQRKQLDKLKTAA